MNFRQRIFLMIAVVAACGVALLVFGILGSKDKNAPPAPQPKVINVLVAARDIMPGLPLTEEMVQWQSWPQDNIQPSFITSKTASPTGGTISGSVARAQIVKGEPVTQDKIIKSTASGYMAATLTPGMRAVSLPISIDNAVGGFIQPENRVDILLTHSRSGRPATDIILKNIRILAVDQRIGTEGDGKAAAKTIRTITLELTPEQAKDLSRAKATGGLALALRPLSHTPENSVYDTSGPIVIIRGDAEWRGK